MNPFKLYVSGTTKYFFYNQDPRCLLRLVHFGDSYKLQNEKIN